ncbi:MAG: dihydroorotate dehydrogenase [Candidatus Nitrosopolaris sp.]
MKTRKQSEHDRTLSINVAGMELRNPTMLASGFLGISQAIFDRLYNADVGAIVSKSISNEPIEGYSNPTAVCLEGGSYLNAVGLANPGADAFSREIASNPYVPIIVSLVGSSYQDFPPMIDKFDDLNILGYEVNLSCPHVAKMGMEVGDDLDMVTCVVKTVKSHTLKPVVVKVGIGNVDLLDLARAAYDAGANAITAINTIRAMTIDIESGIPVLSNRIGGLSGKSVKPIAIRCVYEISKNVGVPVIGCGGIFSWEDAIEFMLAGASAIQLSSVIGHEGVGIFQKINLGLKKYLERKGLKNPAELVGLAHKY